MPLIGCCAQWFITKARGWGAGPWLPFFRSRRGAVALLLMAAALALRLLGMALVPLVSEEAYYWMYAQHPALSYFDHPPMVAWVTGLGTAVAGNTEFGVRLVGSLLMLGASLLMYRFGRAWFSPAAGSRPSRRRRSCSGPAAARWPGSGAAGAGC
jgi:hypothetical protein